MKRELKIRIISLAAAILAVVAMATDLRANVSSCTFNNLTHNCILRRYGFKYDGLGRLTSAAYSEPSGRQSGNAISGAASYATAYTYGLDSRPLTVRRLGVSAFVPSGSKSIPKFGLIDNLTFTYTGSRLTKVSDAAADVVYAGASDFNDGANSATEYTYDSDGRLLSDANKDITSIKYNSLGLPSEITFGDGSSITNLYSAYGTLLQRVKAEPVKLVVQSALPTAVVMPNLNKTADNHIGALTIQNTVVTRIDTPNGYFGAGKMHYYVRDYQGNVRQVTDADGNVEQDNHYYPYGMLMAESSDILAGAGSSTANPYLFGAKEYLTTAGANLLDFTARTYDPSTLLFQTQDPMSGDYTSYLPYLYCGSDPINNVDPTGTIVRALNEESIENICFTLTDREAQYIRFIDGVLDNDLINMSNSGSENMMALKALSNSDVSYIFTTCSEYESDGEIISFEERGLAGITLMPKAQIDPSPDDNVYILTYNGLTKEHQVTNTAHEGYGHAYFYELRRQGFDVNPSHDYGVNHLPPEFDPELGLETAVVAKVDNNIKLKNQIDKTVRQASLNYQSRNK